MATIPNPERERIRVAINKLSDGPHPEGLDTKPLKGRPEWRLRVGSWRVLFLVDNGTITITVIGVGSRGQIYKGS
jgi:mRNA interferase RelE/StbE